MTTEIMDDHQLPRLMEVQVGSSNKIKSRIALSKVPTLSIGEVKFVDVGVFNFDFNDSPIIKCYTNAGLIGKGIIKKAIWQIDYQNKIIRVTDQLNNLPNLESAKTLPVEFNKILDPFVEIEINERKQKFLIDFASGGFISLTEKTAQEYKFSNTMQSIGEGGIGANGITQEPIFVSTLQSIKIADQKFTNQVASHAKSNNYNLLGSELAKHFIVTLNFPKNELLLTPLPQVAPQPFKTFGFSINVNDKQIYINRIYEGSSADKNGIQLKDIVLSINSVTVQPTSLCDSFLKLRQVIDTADELKIKVQRNNNEYEYNLLAEELK